MADRFTLYRFWNAAGDLLYVGLSGDPQARWRGHRANKPWWREIAQITLEHFDTLEDLKAAETAAIQTECPAYNVHHRRPSRCDLFPIPVRTRPPAIPAKTRSEAMPMDEPQSPARCRRCFDGGWVFSNLNIPRACRCSAGDAWLEQEAAQRAALG